MSPSFWNQILHRLDMQINVAGPLSGVTRSSESVSCLGAFAVAVIGFVFVFMMGLSQVE